MLVKMIIAVYYRFNIANITLALYRVLGLQSTILTHAILKFIQNSQKTILALLLPGEPGQFYLWPGRGQGS